MTTLYFNGIIHTQDAQRKIASACIVRDGKFLAVGGNELIAATVDQRIDMQGNTMLPGFVDAHIHIWKVGNLLTNMLDLRGVSSMDEMLQMIEAYATAHPEQNWIQARGFNEADFPDKRMPNKTDLDKVVKDRPVVVTRTCAHQIIVNSKALELSDIHEHTETPQGGEIKYLPDGKLAGHFTETAIGLVLRKIPKYSAEELRNMVLAAQDALLQLGITTATDPAVDKDLLQVYKDMDRAGELRMRINAIPIRVPDGSNKVYPNPEKYSSDFLEVNTVKFFADGGLSGKTAALLQPYKNSNERGVLRFTQDDFYALAKSSQDAGLRIATHAIGDAAIDLVVKTYAAISNGFDHRVEHVGLPHAQHLALMHKHNIHAVMQPIFIRELGKNFLDALEADRLSHLYPANTILRSGINLALSTDAPVVKSIDPKVNIESAVSRQSIDGFAIGPAEAISREDAIFAYTNGAALANGSTEYGRISEGYLADFQIVDSISSLKALTVNVSGITIR